MSVMTTDTLTKATSHSPPRHSLAQQRYFPANYATQVLLTSLPLLVSDLVASVLAYLIIASLFAGETTMTLAMIALGGLPVLLAFAGLYPANTMSVVRESRGLFLGTFLMWSIVAVVGIGLQVDGAVGLWFVGVVAAVLCPLLRSLVRQKVARFRWWGQRIVVLGGTDADASMRAWKEVKCYRTRGLLPVGILHDSYGVSDEVSEYPFLGPTVEADQVCQDQQAYGVFVPASRFNETTAELDDCPNLQGLISSKTHVESFGRPSDAFDYRQLRFDWRLDEVWSNRIKRTFDLAILALFSPLIGAVVLVLAVIVRLTSKGPVFYQGERIGLGGRVFQQWKFRTMVEDAEQVLERYLAEDPKLREEWDATQKLQNDPRVTRVGQVLRTLSLDELPQLWNVFRGEMSLVGPRPITAREAPRYGRYFHTYKQVNPGLTGLWQVSGRSDTTYRERVALDVYYARNWSPWFDAFVMFKTISVVVLKTGAY